MRNLQLFLSGRTDRLLLKILAKIHVATKRQLQAFARLANPEEPEEAQNNYFKRLLDLGLIEVKKARIQSGLGAVRTRAGCPRVVTDIYFLTEAGVSSANTIFTGIGKYAHAGEPLGINADRIYHDLLITEALLHTSGIYEVLDFANEAELKSEIFRARSCYKHSENTGDFRVDYLQNKTADFFYGEIVLQSKREQLLGKPSNLVFYTDCRQTADFIEENKKTGAFILENVLEIRREKIQKNEHNFTNLERKIVQLFALIPAGLDAETVAVLLDKQRSKVSSCLFNLVRKDVFTYQFLQNSTGRPIKLYAHKSIKNFDNLAVRKQFYLTGLLLKSVVKNNSIIESFNVENCNLVLKHYSGKRMEVFTDNLQNSIEENIKNFIGLKNLNGNRVDGIKFATLDSNRFEAAEKLMESKFLIKLTTN